MGLLKRENLENENARNYIRVLDEKSQRLKQLTEDLVEASKISSGNIQLDMQTIDLVELLYQTGGEFNERFEARGLTIVTKLPHNSVMIRADGHSSLRQPIWNRGKRGRYTITVRHGRWVRFLLSLLIRKFWNR